MKRIVDPKVGDRVYHADVAGFFRDTGTIIALAKQPLGGDCLVRWDRHPLIHSEECLSNLALRTKK